MGPVDDRAARQDRRGVEEGGEERVVLAGWAARGDAEDGEAGAVLDGVRGRLPVPRRGGEPRRGGSAGGGAGRDLPEDGGGAGPAAAADPWGIPSDRPQPDRGPRCVGPGWEVVCSFCVTGVTKPADPKKKKRIDILVTCT